MEVAEESVEEGKGSRNHEVNGNWGKKGNREESLFCSGGYFDWLAVSVSRGNKMWCMHQLHLHHGEMKLSEEKAECSAFDCCLGKDTPVQ